MTDRKSAAWIVVGAEMPTNRHQAVLETVKSHFHDWAIKEPDTVLAYVNVKNEESEELLNGPPLGFYLRKDRQIISTQEGTDPELGGYFKEVKIFYGSENACVAFTQLVDELDSLAWRYVSKFRADDWYDHLFFLANERGGFGKTTIIPSTWDGAEIRWVTDQDPRPLHVCGYLQSSPFIASEMAIAELLLDSTRPDSYVTLDQAAGISGQSKRTLERYVQDQIIPKPCFQGGGGRPHKWRWSVIRPLLQEHLRPDLPEIFPGSQPS